MEEQDSEKIENMDGTIEPASDNVQDSDNPINATAPNEPAVENIQHSEVQNEIIESTDNATENIQPTKVKISFSKTIFGKIIIGFALVIFLFFAIFFLPGILQRAAVSISLTHDRIFSTNNETEMADDKAILESSINKLNKQIDAYMPTLAYMIINSTDNEFTLKKGTEVLRKGKCSTGSYVILEDDKQQKWLFKTPKGVRKVLSKKKDPVWTKPNWAFIEEGLPVPSANDPSRFEEGVLGDYALSLGNGYMIHGTIWQRYLGLPVTHGCVRLNDADLEVVFNTLSKGSNVYIF
jgi:L,D-transpeptidase ErfK/SrfK